MLIQSLSSSVPHYWVKSRTSRWRAP